jgi:uncharacterized protein (TIGR03067 family)
MTRRILLVLAAWLLVGAVPKEDGADLVNVDASRMQGTWLLSSMELGGETFSPDDYGNFALLFAGHTLTIREGTRRPSTETFKLDTGQTPKAIDLTLGGESAPGIYELDGDRLTLCLELFPCAAGAAPRKGRPSAFRSEQGTALAVLKLQRDKR